MVSEYKKPVNLIQAKGNLRNAIASDMGIVDYSFGSRQVKRQIDRKISRLQIKMQNEIDKRITVC